MNQILETNTSVPLNYHSYLAKKSPSKIYLFIFIFSFTIIAIIICYLFFSYFQKIKQNQKTSFLKNQYNVLSLYHANSHYDIVKLSENISIIGLIEIPSIQISYPILANSDENLLKISVCRFSGPLPNRIGNLCIAGHNYRNNMLFSKLEQLNIHDSIFITDLNNNRMEYTVYNKLKVKQNDLNCMTNTTDIQITLVTCNENNNKERIVIKAKMKD